MGLRPYRYKYTKCSLKGLSITVDIKASSVSYNCLYAKLTGFSTPCGYRGWVCPIGHEFPFPAAARRGHSGRPLGGGPGSLAWFMREPRSAASGPARPGSPTGAVAPLVRPTRPAYAHTARRPDSVGARPPSSPLPRIGKVGAGGR
jgi:hypothetical protein